MINDTFTACAGVDTGMAAAGACVPTRVDTQRSQSFIEIVTLRVAPRHCSGHKHLHSYAHTALPETCGAQTARHQTANALHHHCMLFADNVLSSVCDRWLICWCWRICNLITHRRT